jgi:hypothetical protein
MKLYSAVLPFVEEILLECGKSRRTVTYSELARMVNARAGTRLLPEKGRSLGSALAGCLHTLCADYYRRFGVLPGSLVVLSKSGKPSRGYFDFLRGMGILEGDEELFWRTSLENFFAFCRRLP